MVVVALVCLLRQCIHDLLLWVMKKDVKIRFRVSACESLYIAERLEEYLMQQLSGVRY